MAATTKSHHRPQTRRHYETDRVQYVKPTTLGQIRNAISIHDKKNYTVLVLDVSFRHHGARFGKGQKFSERVRREDTMGSAVRRGLAVALGGAVVGFGCMAASARAGVAE